MFKLRPYQSACYQATVKGHEEHDSILVEKATGLGKAQPDSELVLTPSGWECMGRVNAGDHVIGADGKPVIVESIHPQGWQPIYRVMMSDGTSTRCTGNHLWNVRTKHDKYRDRPWRTMSLDDIRNKPHMEWFCPVVSPVQFEQKNFFETPLNPYLLGVLLGDGHLKDTGVMFASADEFIVEEVESIVGEDYGLHVRHAGKYDYAITHGIPRKGNALLALLRRLRLSGKRSHNKHIPYLYLLSSLEDRLALLQGLMDTDGNLNPGGTSGEFCSTSRQLADGVAFLVRSLGGVTRVRRKKIKGYRDAFRVNVSPPNMNPFRLPRKADQYTFKTTYEPTRRIVGIEECGTEPCTCIKVDSDEGLYVTNDFIVTHNTVYFTKYASEWGRDGGLFSQSGRVLVICPQITLIGQAAKKIRKETGIMPAIEQAENWSNESEWARSPFVVASKQTLTSGNGTRRYERFKDVGLVIVDEAHYAVTELYANMLGWFRDRGAKVLGVTATAKRHDKRAMGQVFDECVYQYGIQDAIPDGWLVPVKVTCKQLEKLDLSEVTSRNSPIYGQDFNQKQLNEKLENPEVIYEISEAINQETRNKKTAVYCSSVNEAQAVAEYLVDRYEIKADWICADKARCTDKRREETMRSFTEDPEGVSHLCNVGMLTTGWDFPGLECIVNARPTRSLALYTQIFGRLTRPAERDGRPVVDQVEDCADARKTAIAESVKPYGRMIDLVDNSLEHKLVTAVDVLGGRWSLAERELVKEQLKDKEGPVEIDDEVLEARRELERREEERLRAERAKRKARAKFSDREVDPFGGRRGSSRLNGKYKEPASDKQCRYLWVLGLKDVNQFSLSKAQAGRMITQFKNGKTADEVKYLNGLKQRSGGDLAQFAGEPSGTPTDQEMFDLFR